MTEFLDKNAWMKTVYVMTGHERSKKARSLCNEARNTKIKSFKEKPKFNNSKALTVAKGSLSFGCTLQDLMSERVRVRSRRNAEAERQTPITQRTISEIRGGVEEEIVWDRMSKTTKEWWPGNVGLRWRENSCRAKISEVDGLEEWQRQTCHGHWINNKQQYLSMMGGGR